MNEEMASVFNSSLVIPHSSFALLLSIHVNFLSVCLYSENKASTTFPQKLWKTL
jgi:hypothetical protein